jgi:hypothetical protein
MNTTQIYTSIPVTNHLFNWWSIALWAIAFVLMIMLFTSAWKYIWHISILMAIGGWLCVFYAGFTGDSFIGWFAWTIFLSMALFVRVFINHFNIIEADKRT